MYRSFVAAAVAALIDRTVAQTADFVNMTFGPVTVGSMLPVTYSEGNGQLVTLNLANATWTWAIFENRAADASPYDWTVSVPDSFAEGNYYLTLTQVGAGTSTSPNFGVSFSTLPPVSSSSTSGAQSISPTLGTTMSTSMTPNATVIVSPTITVVCPVIWYDDDCSCTKTTTTPVVMPTPTSTEYVWYDTNCGCSKTAVIPTATLLPTCPGTNGCSNYTAPMTTPAAMPPAGTAMTSPAGTGPAGWMGAASSVRLSGSMVTAIVFVAAAFAL